MSKFRAGELVEVVSSSGNPWSVPVGHVVEILEVRVAKYGIARWNGRMIWADEWQLRKLPGDDQSDCIPAVTRKLFTTKQRNPDDVPVKERA